MKEQCKICKNLHKQYENSGQSMWNGCLAGSGSGQNKIMIVLNSPGKEEIINEVAFSGRMEKYFDRQFLDVSDIDKRSCRMTYAVQCRPLSDRQPRDTEIRNCRPNLVKQIQKYEPKVIIALGSAAWKSLTGLGYLNKWQGLPVWSREFNCYIMPMLHPGYHLANRTEYDIYNALDDLNYATTTLLNSDKQNSKVRLTHIKTDKQHDRLLDKLFESKVFSMDIETANKSEDKISDFLTDEIIGISFAVNKKEGFFVEWDRILQHKDEYYKLFKSDREKVIHNCSFDIKFLKTKGFVFNHVFDTLIAHHLLDENFAGQHGVKPLTWRYTAHGGYEVEMQNYIKKHKIKDFGKIPIEMLVPYACYDAVVILEMYEIFKEDMEEKNLSYLFNNISMPTRMVLNEMEYKGIRVNVKQVKDIGKKLGSDLDYLNGKITRIASRNGLKEFNSQSPKQLTDLLYNKLGLPILKRTKKSGNPSTDEEVLKALKGKHKLIDCMIEFRKLAKYNSTYVEPVIDRLDKLNRMHTNLLSHGTVTGRLSSTPNLQNIPRDQDIRSMFIPAKDYVFVDGDLSQAELRALAHYCKDPFMLQVFKDDEDIHTMVAVELLNKPAEEITKEERVIVKSINFGIIYGMQAPRLAKTLGISIEKAQDYMDKYFVRFSRVKNIIQKTIDHQKEHGYIENAFGRRRRIPMVEYDELEIRRASERELFNALIQGTAVDITNIALCRINKAFKKEKIIGQPILQVHDQVLSEIHKDCAEDAKAIVKEEMERPIKQISVPMKADVDICKKWGMEYEPLGFIWRDIKQIIK